MSLLYELDDNPQVAIAEIRAHYRQPTGAEDGRGLQRRLLDDVAAILTDDDYVDPNVSARIARTYEAVDLGSPEIRGPLGLYVALNTATTIALAAAADEVLFEKTKLALEDDATQACFRALYSIDPIYQLAESHLHRVGTTSLILECPLSKGSAKPEIVALKCLLPRYHKVQAIRTSTSAYMEEHSYKESRMVDHAGVPYIYDSTPLTIAMEFIPGPTLAEEFATRAVPDGLPKEERISERALDDRDIAFIREVGLAVCERLEELARLGNHHLDLSPSNIILTNHPGEPIRVSLIDFGHNFAITERVGTSTAFRRAALYVAPELVEDPLIDDWRCDAYSLGVILLEAAAKREIHAEDLSGELDRLWQGERPWEGAPVLARVIEELIDHHPQQRLALMEETDPTVSPYDYLRKLILQETEVLSLYERRTGGSGFGLLRGLGLFKLRKNAQVMNLLEADTVIEEPVDESYADYPGLARWATVSIICWVLTLTAFTALSLADIGWAAVVPSVSQLANDAQVRFRVGAFWDNLPGRLVALTFGLTAVTYYVNNFSTLSPKRVATRMGLASEVAMRATALGLVFPIMWAMLYDPNAWPICAGIGTMLVVVNNFLALRVAVHAYRVGSRFTTRKAAGDSFITDVFKEWWVLMGAYSLSMIAIGILIIVHEAHDEAIFAVFVVAINIAKMYRLNCVETAPKVRGCLSRDILTLRRADRLHELGVPVPSGAADPKPTRFTRLAEWWWTPTPERVQVETA